MIRERKRRTAERDRLAAERDRLQRELFGAISAAGYSWRTDPACKAIRSRFDQVEASWKA
jgi:hypothetical protein